MKRFEHYRTDEWADQPLLNPDEGEDFTTVPMQLNDSFVLSIDGQTQPEKDQPAPAGRPEGLKLSTGTNESLPHQDDLLLAELRSILGEAEPLKMTDPLEQNAPEASETEAPAELAPAEEEPVGTSLACPPAEEPAAEEPAAEEPAAEASGETSLACPPAEEPVAEEPAAFRPATDDDLDDGPAAAEAESAPAELASVSFASMAEAAFTKADETAKRNTVRMTAVDPEAVAQNAPAVAQELAAVADAPEAEAAPAESGAEAAGTERKTRAPIDDETLLAELYALIGETPRSRAAAQAVRMQNAKAQPYAAQEPAHVDIAPQQTPQVAAATQSMEPEDAYVRTPQSAELAVEEPSGAPGWIKGMFLLLISLLLGGMTFYAVATDVVGNLF